MGKKKIGIVDTVKEGEEIGKEGIEEGRKLEQDGSEIKDCLDRIDRSMDEEDVERLDKVENDYDVVIHAEFDDQVETKREMAEKMENTAIDKSGNELDKVNDATDRLLEMAGVTELGAEYANQAADGMRRSAADYQSLMDQAGEICEDTHNQVESIKSSLGRIFHR